MITMQNKRRGAALVASAAAMGVLIAGCNSGGGSGATGATGSTGATLNGTDVVATVNGEAITQADFYSQLQRYTPNQQQMSAAPAGRVVLQQMIMTLLLEQLAKAEGVPPTDAQIDERLDAYKMSMDSVTVQTFDELMAKAGLTENEVKTFQIKPQMAQLNLLTKGVTITDADIQSYYDLHKKDQFTKPNRAHIKRIAVPTAEEANSIYDDIQKGKPFEDYVSKSMAKQPADGDMLQWVNLDDATNATIKPLVTAITAAKVGDVPKPIPLEGVWWIIKVVDKKPQEVPAEATVKNSIKYVLLGQKMQQNATGQQEIGQKLHDFQAKANIEITPKQYADLVAEIKTPPAPMMAPPGMSAPQSSAPGGPRPGAPVPAPAPAAPKASH